MKLRLAAINGDQAARDILLSEITYEFKGDLRRTQDHELIHGACCTIQGFMEEEREIYPEHAQSWNWSLIVMSRLREVIINSGKVI